MHDDEEKPSPDATPPEQTVESSAAGTPASPSPDPLALDSVTIDAVPTATSRGIVYAAPRVTRLRGNFQRRVAILFASGFAAFSFTTWLLTRTNIGDAGRDATTPEGVVRMQLDALGRGEAQSAYGLFSPQYRAEVSFEAFQHVIVVHNEMFRANSEVVEEVSRAATRAEMRVHIGAADGQHYVARYSTVLIENRWWIDAMRWRVDEAPPERIFTDLSLGRCGAVEWMARNRKEQIPPAAAAASG